MNRSPLLVIFATLCVPGLALGAQHDTPAISVYGSGQAKIAITVDAGVSGAPAGFTIEWMKQSDFLASGSQWVGQHSSVFDGTPTLNLWGATTFLLPSSGSAIVEIGDLFDETGVTATSTKELVASTAYIFRAYANGDASFGQSGYTADVTGSTQGLTNCVFTQGYWKNHPEAWPVTSLTIGGVVYTDAELLSILNTPAKGNGLISMAHQLIAAMLNVANGADSTNIQATIDSADLLISSSCAGDPVPPIGGCSISPGTTSPTNDTLDSYNNGNLGVPHCGPVSVESGTWGVIKAGYR